MKKFFALLIAVAMVLSLVTVPAVAQTTSHDPKTGTVPRVSNPRPLDAATVDEALNVPGGTLEFVNTSAYPWVVDGDAAKSGNGGVASSESTIYTTVEAAEGDIVQFEYMAWGEGSDSYDWDKCRFSVDGTVLMDYGAHDNDWETFQYGLTAGSHTLTWTYKKDSSVNPTGDYFKVDNVYVGQPVMAEEITVEDVTVPAGRRADVVYEVLPAATYDKSVTFAIADTNIATVDANGKVTGVAEGTTTITVTSVAVPEVSGTATVTVTEALPTVYLYGFDTYDIAGAYDNMWIEFPDYDPTDYAGLASLSGNAWAAAFAGGQVYGYLYDSNGLANDFFIMDPETFSVAYPGTNANNVSGILGMAYDHANDVMYGISGGDTRQLCTIDLATGVPTVVAAVTGMTTPLTFAISTEGVAYSIEYQTGDLYTIDLETAVATRVGATGVGCAYVQSMCFDHVTGQLFWAQILDGSTHGLYVINPETAQASFLGMIGPDGGEICGLYTKDNIEIPPIEMPNVTVTFVDGTDDSVIDTWEVEAGTVLDENDFPTPPEHEGLEFVGWDYDGSAVYTDLTIKARYRDPNAQTAIVTLNVPSDVWGDGSGYQMLLDADATAYGTIIPTSGGLTSSGDAPAGVYDEFEYKIPENADGAMSTQNMLVQGSISIEIPGGVYDWCITNPTPGDRIWIASSNGNIPGRYDDYEFEAGNEYIFTVTFGGSNDQVDLEIVPGGNPPVEPTEPPVEPTDAPSNPPVVGDIWDFETDPEAQGFQFIDQDGDGNNWEWRCGSEWADFNYHEGQGYMMSASYINYVGALTPDNWMITPEFEGDTLTFWAQGQDASYAAEYIGAFVSTDGGATWSSELAGWTLTGSDTQYTVDLAAYASMRTPLKVALRHYNVTDMFQANVDYIEVAGGTTPDETPAPTDEPGEITEPPVPPTPGPDQIGIYVDVPEEIAAGEDFEAVVRIDGEYEAHTFNYNLVYDAANFDVVSVANGDVIANIQAAGGMALVDYTTVPGMVKLGGMCPTNPFTGEIVFTVTFHAHDDIAEGYYEFGHQVDEFNYFPVDGNSTPLDYVAVPGYVHVPGEIVEPTEPPVEPTEPPVEPTEPPVEPTEPPVEPTEPPVEPTEPPVEPTEPPVEPTEVPVTPGPQPGDVIISAPDVYAQPGDTVEIPVTFNGAFFANGLNMQVNFDPTYLTIESYTAGDLMNQVAPQGGLNIIDYTTVPGSFRWGVAFAMPTSGLTNEDGEIVAFTIVFHVSEEATEGMVFPIEIEVSEFFAMPETTAEEIARFIDNGSITIGEEPVEPTEPPVEPTEPAEPTPEPTTPPTPPTGTIALVGAGIAAIVAGAGVVLFRRKED